MSKTIDFIKNYTIQKNETPLDKMPSDGGFTAIFRKIAVVGDSLASGELEAVENGEKRYLDKFEYSWGQFIARKTGAKVYNFSRGGMTAREYINSFAQSNGMWDESKACELYIIALGVNDILIQDIPMGSIGDICLDDYTKNPDTFVGKYAQIIQRYKEISPNAYFFLMTMPPTDKTQSCIRKCEEHSKAIYSLKDFFDKTYVIDLKKYGPDYSDENFKKQFFLEGHLNVAGYKLTADVISWHIDYIVRKNITDFLKFGL